MTFFRIEGKQIRSSFKMIAFLLVVGFLFKAGITGVVFAAGQASECGMFDIKENCMGGWMHIILGDVAIGALLAVFLHVLAHRSNMKLESNARTIQKIIEMQEEQRNRRKDYSVFNLKNLFTHMLHILGQVNKSVSNFNSFIDSDMEKKEIGWRQQLMLNEIHNEENRLARVINTTRNNLLSVNDVLEPDIVNQIEGVCMYLSEIKIQETPHSPLAFPKYETSKKKIKYVIEKLNTYTVERHSFSENKKHNIEDNKMQKKVNKS